MKMINEQLIVESRKRLEELNISLMYEVFPADFKVDINGWSFPDDKEKGTIDVELTPEEIAKLKNKGLLKKAELIFGHTYRIRRLRTLDIEIGAEETIDRMNALKTRYDNGEFAGPSGMVDINLLKIEFAKLYNDICTQRCPHCFNQEDDFYVSKIINGQKLMKWSEIKELIRVAKRFGLESVKFLGIGEIFKNLRLFEILDDLQAENIRIGIFTKGPALGDDETAKSCGYEGIYTAEDLVKRISEYQNVSILLGANSFNLIFQDTMVGCGKDAGVAKCQQKHNGMYIRLPGAVQECPGRCVGAEILEDVRVQNLITTWLGSINYDRKDCRSLCAVKMKDLTGNNVKVCDCCKIYENVGSMPPELEMRVIEGIDSLVNEKLKSAV